MYWKNGNVIVTTQSEVREYGERAGSKLVDYLDIEAKMRWWMMLVGNYDLSEGDRDEMKNNQCNHFNLELKN